MFDFSWAGGELESVFWHREELKEYTPKTLQPSLSSKALQNHVATLLRTRKPLQPRDAKIQFIGEETSKSASVSMLLQFLECTFGTVHEVVDDSWSLERAMTIEFPDSPSLWIRTCSPSMVVTVEVPSLVGVCSGFSELCTSCVLIDILAAHLFSGQKRTGHPLSLLRMEPQKPGREGEVVNLTF